jgi:uncharacterized protein (DUF1501 family)
MKRRAFLGQSSCAALSSLPVLNTILNLKLANHAAAQDLLPGTSDRKALVCIFLQGGNDSYNMLVPTAAPEYTAYANARSNLAISQASLIGLNQLPPASGGDGRSYGLHPSLTNIAHLFNGTGPFATAGRRAAFVANVGTLIQPTTLAQYLAGSVPLPKALFSHSDQIEQWQTSLPQGGAQLTGWAGRAADIMHSAANQQQVSMSFSLGGNNIFQVGNQTEQLVISAGGALSFSNSAVGPANLLALKNRGLKSAIEQTYANTMDDAFARLTKGSAAAQEFFQTAFSAQTLTPAVEAMFPAGNFVASNLRAVVKTILARQALGLRRQTFFVSYGGWDHHGELLGTQAAMLAYLDAAISGFQRALDALGLSNDVVSFTASDFGRTLRSNGRGTDHAWGGNSLIFGGPVRSGRVHGSYPLFDQTGPDQFGPVDVGFGGRLLPTTSVDTYFATMLRWFGVSQSNLGYVLPNLANFSSNPALNLFV